MASQHALLLLQQLNSQREFGFLCDVTIAIGDVLFRAHKAVLAAFSDYFKTLFTHQNSECVRLQVCDVQPDVFSALLNLMYTGRLSADVDPSGLSLAVHFLHTRALLDTASPAHLHAPLPASAAALYGIQISSMQNTSAHAHTHSPSADMDPHHGLESPFTRTRRYTHVTDVDMDQQRESHAHTPPRVAEGWSEQEDGTVPGRGVLSRAGESNSTSCSTGESACSIRHVKPSIMGRGVGVGSRRQQHVCQVCGRSFVLRSALREHLTLHTNSHSLTHTPTHTSHSPSSDCHPPLPTVPSGITMTSSPERLELLLGGGGISMATAAITAAFRSSALWDGEGEGPGVSLGGANHPSPRRRPHVPISVPTAHLSQSLSCSPSADTPSDITDDITDTDSLEGAGAAGLTSLEFLHARARLDKVNNALLEQPNPIDVDSLDVIGQGSGVGGVAKRRKYSCVTCGRRFIQKSHWREHTYIHTGKPYRCQACGKSFCRANQAARHVCTGHTHTQENHTPAHMHTNEPHALTHTHEPDHSLPLSFPQSTHSPQASHSPVHGTDRLSDWPAPDTQRSSPSTSGGGTLSQTNQSEELC
ncbi:zinc finger and BTB domain-containing protein 2-like [Engraulis encrasicolus]|uniref:zinc finger and BTB domain-containing protein 2-like n=1 Tax=Engraulis encrasicolus TaxID=184585 RepID=UPI002FD36377